MVLPTAVLTCLNLGETTGTFVRGRAVPRNVVSLQKIELVLVLPYTFAADGVGVASSCGNNPPSASRISPQVGSPN